LLRELGHEVIVANARKVRLVGESRKKDDRLDAQTLARLARIDPELLYPVKHRSVQAQADLTLIRARAGLVRAQLTMLKDCGHFTFIDCPIPVHEAIDSFVAGTPPGRHQ
jgi:transposase